MADEVVYRLIAGEGIQLLEDSATRTVTVAVPSLDQKVNVGDIGQASEVTSGIIELANAAEMLDLSDPGRAVTPAGIAGILQSSASDATAGRLLRVGAFGLGGVLPFLSPGTDLNSLPVISARWRGGSLLNAPMTGWFLIDQMVHENAWITQVAYGFAGADNRAFFRQKTGGTWGFWHEHYHTGNFAPASKANTSGQYLGLDVGNAATVGGQLGTDLAPPGMRGEFFTSTPPNGWLKANGAAVSRTTYARLFATIGTLWGAGNGSTTFNLPDARGEFSRAWDDGRGLDAGRAFGSVQGSQNLAHAHSGNTAGQSADHTHNVTLPTNLNTGTSFGVPGQEFVNGGASSSTHTTGIGSSNHTHAISSDGGSEARPRNVAVLVCIKY